jgi:hypothetical protein
MMSPLVSLRPSLHSVSLAVVTVFFAALTVTEPPRKSQPEGHHTLTVTAISVPTATSGGTDGLSSRLVSCIRCFLVGMSGHISLGSIEAENDFTFHVHHRAFVLILRPTSWRDDLLWVWPFKG